VLALPAVAAVMSGVGAVLLARRRDHGAGLIPARPGPPGASAWLRGPAGLVWRLQRGSLAAWVAGVLAGSAATGAAAKGIGSLLSGSSQLRQAFLRLGGARGISTAYLAAVVSLFALVAAGYATSAVLRIRAEEAPGLADLLLAAPVSRARWWAAHVGMAVAGTAAVLAACGIGAGLGYGLRISDPGGQVARLTGATVAQLPAVLVVAAVALLLSGVRPRLATAGSWVVLAVTVLVALLGALLRLSHWVLDVSPFTHAPKLPGAPVTAAPLAWLSVIAVTLTAAGLAGLRRRDIG
jgi:ABC-2 type transport system permease protein